MKQSQVLLKKVVIYDKHLDSASAERGRNVFFFQVMHPLQIVGLNLFNSSTKNCISQRFKANFGRILAKNDIDKNAFLCYNIGALFIILLLI